MKNRFKISVLPSALILFALTGAEAAGGETAADSLKVDPFVPTWESFMSSGDSDVSLGSQMEVESSFKGWNMNSLLRVESKSYRGRDMQDIVENLMNRATKERKGLYEVEIMIGELYTKKKTLGLARFGKDLIFDKESAKVEAALTKPLLRATSSQISIMGDVRQGQSDFKYDRTTVGGASGTFTYGFGGLLELQGGGGIMRMRESSEVGSITFGSIPSSADTVRLAASYGRSKTKLLAVQYSKVSAIERKVSPPRGNSLEILDDPEAAQQEEARINRENIGLTSNARIFSFLSLGVEFAHDVSSQKNKVETRLSKETENTSLRATSSYLFSRSGYLQMSVITSEKSDDYGPLSLSSFREKENALGMHLSQDFTDSLSVSVTGSASLKQRYYKKREANPRDADNLYYRLEATVLAAPIRNVSTDITGTMTRNEVINIDGTLSSDNRVDYFYRLVPKITVHPASWFSLSQEYSIKIEYTDFVYKEDENYLNRTTTSITSAQLNAWRRLFFSFRNTYLMKDSGSYLMRDGVRRYNRSGESFEYGLFMQAQYRALDDLTLVAEVDFRNQQNNRLGFQEGGKVVTSSTSYDSGGLRLGVTRNRKFWGNGKLDFNINYVRRYGPYLSAEKREYWDIDSSITFGF